MGLFDRLSQIGSAIDKATRYVGPEGNQNIAKDLNALGQNIVSSLDKNEKLQKILPVPFSDVMALGGAFMQMVPTLQAFAKDVSKNGISAIPVKEIGQEVLQQTGIDVTPVTDVLNHNDPEGWINVVPKKMSPTSLPFTPATLMMTAMLVGIEKKLDTIRETQEAILSFLEKEKQAEQQGNLRTLTDILNGYKYNWENQQYKQNMHMKALDIKQASDANIYRYYTSVLDELAKAPSLQRDANVKAKIRNLENMMDQYRLAVYLFGFSSFLEMLLLGNFNQQYLDQVADRIRKYDQQYRSLFDRCNELVKKVTESSVETRVMTGLGNLSKAIGNWASSQDALKEKAVGKWFQSSGDKLKQNNDARVEQNKALFQGSPETGSYLFIDSIKNIVAITQTKDISFDGENMYLNVQ